METDDGRRCFCIYNDCPEVTSVKVSEITRGGSDSYLELSTGLCAQAAQ